MAARHEHAKDALHSRLITLRQMLGKGDAISRIPRKVGIEVGTPVIVRPGSLPPLLYVRMELDRSHLGDASVFGIVKLKWRGITTKEYSEPTCAITEINMAHYQQLIRERNGIERHLGLRQWFPGWVPASERVSPFGPPETRFRKFDPAPAFPQYDYRQI